MVPIGDLRVLTIGHSTRTLPEIMRMLEVNGVQELVDVRSFPGSRKFPQWNKDVLEQTVPPAVGYQWIESLGGRRYTPVNQPTQNDGWRVKVFRDYADYMATQEFADGIERLMAIAHRRVPAIMCSEAVPWRCHRRLITDALIFKGVKVYDIMSPTSTRASSLNPMAHLHDGTITYPKVDD